MLSLIHKFRFPGRRQGHGLAEDIDEKLRYLERHIDTMTSRINWLLDRIHITTETSGVLDRDGTRFMVIEFIPPSKTKNDDGNFRLRIVPDGSTYDLQIETRVSGTWTDIKKFHG